VSAANKAILRRWFDELARHNVAEDLLAADYVWHASSFGQQGRADTIQFVALVLAAFPDGRCTVEHIVAEGDEVAVRWSFTGTQQGRFMGLAPTGKRVTLGGIGISRIAGGEIVEGWEEWDSASLARQLGTGLEPGEVL
jgi:predicted ester cyclase